MGKPVNLNPILPEDGLDYPVAQTHGGKADSVQVPVPVPTGGQRVIRIFPNEDSAERLIGALLAEIHEEWQGWRYLDMSDFHEWWEAQRPSDRKEDKVVGIDH